MWWSLALNSWSSCFCIPSAGITDGHPHTDCYIALWPEVCTLCESSLEQTGSCLLIPHTSKCQPFGNKCFFLWTALGCGIQSGVAASKVRIINSKLEDLQEKLCPSDTRHWLFPEKMTVLLSSLKETHWYWLLDRIPLSSHLKSILWREMLFPLWSFNGTVSLCDSSKPRFLIFSWKHQVQLPNTPLLIYPDFPAYPILSTRPAKVEGRLLDLMSK